MATVDRRASALRPPSAPGQLVWCPADPSLGVGVVARVGDNRVHVRFLRLQEERVYTTRGAEGVIARYEIGPGERVRHGEHAHVRVVRRVAEHDDLAVYLLEDGSEVEEGALAPEVRDIGPKARLATLNLTHPEVVRARMLGLQLAQSFARPGVAGALGARVLWLPHQIDVAARAVESDRVRLLLADEVGLGKTVEAALIYAGLRYEGRADRVLILTPDALAIQWLGEIYRKAHELLVLLDDDRLEDARRDFPDLNPFEAHQRLVVSIDKVTADVQLMEEMAAARWDLVIVDEAHHLRWDGKQGGNAKYRLVEALGANSTHLLLLTATPMALDPAEYHALLRLLDAARFDDPSAFDAVRERVNAIRTVARAVDEVSAGTGTLPAAAKKSAAELLADDEEDADLVTAFTKAKGAERRRAADGLLGALRQRHGLADFVVRNRRGPVGGMPQRHAEPFMLEPTPAQQKLIEVGESVMLELATTLAEPRERAQTLGRLLRALWATPRALVDILKPLSPALVEHLAPHVAKVAAAPIDGDGLPSGDARLRWLVRLLRRDKDDKLLVFVETDIAVRALRDALEGVLGANIAIFHRGLPPRDQDRQVSWFRDADGPQVMLSTEAGGEGRNFQFCNRVVLYDLPWRPATVEQRIGRVDRVGQKRDVHVLVPCFKGGYEAAVLKVMQDSIGVLDQTVGGIDHALEYVSDRLAGLILDGAGAEGWKALYRETNKLVSETRERIAAAADPILDHASFSPARVQAVLARVPPDLEERIEAFVRGYAGHSKLEIHTKTGAVVGVEGAPGAAGGAETDTAYAATFSRTWALDHEDVEFLSFGHPLVQQALQWAQQADDASAALAICRGFGQDGAAFLWRFAVDLPDDVPEAAAYFDGQVYTFAVDEAGKRVTALENLLDEGKTLDRMDPKPLRAAVDRWRRVVEQTHAAAEKLADGAVAEAAKAATARLEDSFAQKRRHLERQRRRQLAALKPRSPRRAELEAEHAQASAALDAEHKRLAEALGYVRPRLLAAVAVRLVRSPTVSV